MGKITQSSLNLAPLLAQARADLQAELACGTVNPSVLHLVKESGIEPQDDGRAWRGPWRDPAGLFFALVLTSSACDLGNSSDRGSENTGNGVESSSSDSSASVDSETTQISGEDDMSGKLPEQTVEVFREELPRRNAQQLWPIEPLGFLTPGSRGGELFDATLGESVVLADPENGDLGSWQGAARSPTSSAILALRDGKLKVWQSGWVDSPLQDAVERTSQAMWVQGSSLWLAQEDRLVLWHEQKTQSVAVADHPFVSEHAVAIAPKSSASSTRVWWCDGSRIFGLAQDDMNRWQVSQVLAAPGCESLGLDSSGQLWAGDANALSIYAASTDSTAIAHRYTGLSRSPVIWASSESPTVWISDGENWWVDDGQGLRRAKGLLGTGLALDRYGRLYLRVEDSLVRASVDRPVILSGLPADTLLEPTQLFVLPSNESDVQTIRATIAGKEVELSAPPRRVLVDPGKYEGGSYEVEISVTFNDGQVSRATQGFAVGTFGWQASISPIAESSCVLCHSGGTSTLLDTATRWQDNIDSILEEVRSGRMPLGKTPLTPAQLAAIAGWKSGGFQP